MRSILTLSPMARLAGFAPLVVRVIVGIIMTAHGWQKLTQVGPGNFGQDVLAGLGVPLPVFMGYVVTLVEMLGGILLILGLLSRLAALVLTIDLVVALLLVKVDVGLLSPQGDGVGAELDLALIAGLLSILLAGPGKLSLDHLFGLEERAAAEDPLIKRLLSEDYRQDFFAFLITLAPAPVYIIALYFATGGLAPVRDVVEPLVIGACVGYGSFLLNSLRTSGVNAELTRRRQEKIDYITRPNATSQEKTDYKTELSGKIGSTLTTLTQLGAISFAMVVFGLDIVLGEEAENLSGFVRTTVSFIVFLLVITAVMLLVTVESYDTARDPEWKPEEIRRIRGFTVWTYNVALCFLVYTVAFAALVVQPFLGVIAGVVFARLVHIYDRSTVQ